MHPLRRALLIIISPLFPLLLFATAVDWGVVQTVGSPNDVKKIVSDSGIYKSVVPSLLDQMKLVDTSVGQLPTNDPTIKQAANLSFTPEQVQKNTETALDGVYAWLEGKTAQPDFHIDLSGVQKAFGDNLATIVESKANSLPACTTPYTSTAFDVYNATCLPRGVTPAAVAAQVRSDVQNGQGFIDKPIIGPADIKSSDSSNQSVFASSWKNVPQQYQRAKKTPLILALLSILTGAALVFTNPDRWRGLRHIGITLALLGLFMLFFSWGLNRANTNFIQPKITISNSTLQTNVRQLATDIVQRIDKNYWVFGGAYAVLGAAALATPMFLRRTGRIQPVAAPTAEEASRPAAPDKKKASKTGSV